MGTAQDQSQESHLNERSINAAYGSTNKCHNPENHTHGRDEVDGNGAQAARGHYPIMPPVT
jgi:hypothetical protein